MLPSAFSAPLLEDDLLGTADGAPAFLGSQEAAGAACDPAIFLVDDDEPMAAHGPAISPPATAAGTPFVPGGALAPPSAALEVPPRVAPTSADSLLRELECSMDFLLPSQAMESLLLGAPAGSDTWRASPPAAGPSTPPSAAPPTSWKPAPFPSIPEERELPAAQLEPRLPGMAPLQPPAMSTAAFEHSAPSVFVPVPTSPPQLAAAPIPASTPMPTIRIVLSANRPAATPTEAASGSGSEAASPTGSSTSSLQALMAGGSGGLSGAAYPRIASMPNLHLGLSEAVSCSSGPASPAASRRRTSGRPRAIMPRSRSHSDLKAGASSGNGAGTPTGGDMERYNVPHLPFLTPPHLRKGKGGRQPAADPRLDPSIDPKRARRIMANRLSAAKSKMKQKNAAQLDAQKTELDRLQRELMPEATDAMDAAPSPAGEPAADAQISRPGRH